MSTPFPATHDDGRGGNVRQHINISSQNDELSPRSERGSRENRHKGLGCVFRDDAAERSRDRTEKEREKRRCVRKSYVSLRWL